MIHTWYVFQGRRVSGLYALDYMPMYRFARWDRTIWMVGHTFPGSTGSVLDTNPTKNTHI